MLARERLVSVTVYDKSCTAADMLRGMIVKYCPIISEHSLLSPSSMAQDDPWLSEAVTRGIADPAGLILVHESASGAQSGSFVPLLVTSLRYILAGTDVATNAKSSFGQKHCIAR